MFGHQGCECGVLSVFVGVFHLSRFLMVCKVYKLFGKLFEKLWEGIMLNKYSFAPCDLF